MIGKFLKNQAGTFGVSLGQIASDDLPAQPQMARFVAMSVQRKHQIPQAFAVGKLTEHHAQQLVPACEMLNLPLTTVLPDDRIKHTAQKKIRQLCENLFALIHVNCFLRFT